MLFSVTSNLIEHKIQVSADLSVEQMKHQSSSHSDNICHNTSQKARTHCCSRSNQGIRHQNWTFNFNKAACIQSHMILQRKLVNFNFNNSTLHNKVSPPTVHAAATGKDKSPTLDLICCHSLVQRKLVTTKAITLNSPHPGQLHRCTTCGRLAENASFGKRSVEN